MYSCDYHIHTQLSGCADNEFNIEKIIQLQQIRGIESIGITDHDYSYQSKIKTIQTAQQAIKAAKPSIEVHFGVESQMLEYQSTSIAIRLASYFDYVLMAPNHYHLRGVAQPRNFRDPRRVALHEIYMFEAAVACPITDAIVHPFLLSPNVFQFSKEELSAFGQEMMRNIEQKRLIYQLDLISQRGLGVEISPKMVRYNQLHLTEFYQLCMERDVKLLIGSDAHNTKQLEELSLLVPILEDLGVKEEHLWHPNKPL
ncbi:MAG: PHP domain-containing protein [Candidatus Poribacteria bacterium]|nr:PHP domain-containing protein [Candidatus Poribacteria bacterium]